MLRYPPPTLDQAWRSHKGPGILDQLFHFLGESLNFVGVRQVKRNHPGSPLFRQDR